MRALRHPALGLVLVIVALHALPQQLGMLSTMLVVDAPLGDAKFLVLVGTQLAVSALQLATGWAIVRGRPAGGWFAGYFGASVVLSIAAAAFVRGQHVGPGVAIASAFETLGFPVLIAIASMLFPGDELADRPAPRDAAAVLLVLAVSTLVYTPLDLIKQGQLLGGGHTTIGGWLGLSIQPAIALAVAILGVFAALRLMRDPHDRGWRALRIWLVAVIATHLAFTLLALGWTMVEDFGSSAERIRTQLIATRVIGLVDLLGPLAIWWYARASLTGDPERTASPGPPSCAPLWIALTFAPTLLARPFVAGTLMAPLGGRGTAATIVVCLAVGAAILAAAYAAVRGTALARWATLAAAVGGALLVAAGAYYVLASGNRYISMGVIAPLGNLVASTGVAAWLHRRAA